MRERLRWPHRGMLVIVAAAVILASLTSGPDVGPGPVAAVPPVPATAAVPRSEPLRIMPLGSSSTVGTGSVATAGYRGPLEQLLDRERIAYDMVGSQSSGPSWLADLDHEGHGGATMAQMQPFVGEWVSRQRPDVILLQVGTNDLLAGVGPAATAERLDTLLTTIGEVSGAYVIVAGIWAPLPGHAPARAHYARLASAVVARHRAEGGAVLYVDTSTLLAPTDFFDGLHPDVSGYRKIARFWERAIRGYLVDGGRSGRPDLPAADLLAGLRISEPVGGTVVPVAMVAQRSAGPSAPSEPATPGQRPGRTRPGSGAGSGAARPLVRALAEEHPLDGLGTVRAGDDTSAASHGLGLPR